MTFKGLLPFMLEYLTFHATLHASYIYVTCLLV